jgi:hypothetical protein
MRLLLAIPLFLLLLPATAVAQTSACPLDTFIAYIQRNDTAAVRQCLKNGTNPNAEWLGYDIRYFKNTTTVTAAYIVYRRPIFYAINAKSLPMVKLLVEYGASVNKAEWAIKDTIKRHENFPGWFESPWDFAKTRKQPEIQEYLKAHQAKDVEYQYALGERFYNLLEHCRKSPDSLVALKTLIQEHYDEIEFAGTKLKAYVCYDALKYNIWPAVTYLIDQHRADFKRVLVCRPSRSIFGGGGGICGDFEVINGLHFGFASINLVEYLEQRGILNDSLIHADVIPYKYKTYKRIYNYFTLRNKKNLLLKAPQTFANRRKIKHLTRKMERIKKRDMRKRPDLV